MTSTRGTHEATYTTATRNGTEEVTRWDCTCGEYSWAAAHSIAPDGGAFMRSLHALHVGVATRNWK